LIRTSSINLSSSIGRSRLCLLEHLFFFESLQSNANAKQVVVAFSVFATNDQILEGSEIVEVRAYVPAINFKTGFQTVTITEDYRDETTQQDEKTGCSCTCTTWYRLLLPLVLPSGFRFKVRLPISLALGPDQMVKRLAQMV
jgi:hypothetical protein